MLRSKIIPYFPPHKTYVEPFGGGASVLLDKKPSILEVYNDADPRVACIFQAICDPTTLKQFMERVWLTPYSREERKYCREHWDEQTELVEQAAFYFVVSRQSFGGMIDRTSWGLVTTSTSNGMAQPVNSYVQTMKLLPRVHARMANVRIENRDWRPVIEAYDAEDTLFYLDPPYVHGTRRDGWFNCEMTNEDHQALVERILYLKGYAIISGYPNEFYLPLEENGWTRIDFSRTCYAVARTRYTKLQGEGTVKAKQKRTDCLWLNPKVQERNKQNGKVTT